MTVQIEDTTEPRLKLVHVVGRGYVKFERSRFGTKAAFTDRSDKASRMVESDAKSWASTIQRSLPKPRGN